MPEPKRGVWVTYHKHYGGGHQLDPAPSTYSKIAVFDDELAARRHADSRGARAVRVVLGQTLEGAIAEDLSKSGMALA